MSSLRPGFEAIACGIHGGRIASVKGVFSKHLSFPLTIVPTVLHNSFLSTPLCYQWEKREMSVELHKSKGLSKVEDRWKVKYFRLLKELNEQ